MIFDFDDYFQTNNRLDLLWHLKDINPNFRCTVFAIPALGSDSFWECTPDWIELAVHGWDHSNSHEAENWSYERTAEVLNHPTISKFAHGFKAPGWLISDAAYCALLDYGWWIADQSYNDFRRPRGLRVYKLGENLVPPGAAVGKAPLSPQAAWHGHISNVCGNGLEENFKQVARLVANASEFRFVSEALSD